MSQERTIERYLNLLNDMKTTVSLGLPIKVIEFVSKHHVGNMIPRYAIKMGFFSQDETGRWLFNKSSFTKADARRLLDYSYKQMGLSKIASRNKSALIENTKINNDELLTECSDERFFAEFKRRDFIIIDGNIYKKIG